MEIIDAVVDFLSAALLIGVIATVIYMVLQFGISGAWAKRVEWRNVGAGLLIFGMMLLGLQFAPYLTLDSTTQGINRAAEAAPEFREAVGNLLGEIRESVERAQGIDSEVDSDIEITVDDPVIPTTTPLTEPTPFPNYAATATAQSTDDPTASPTQQPMVTAVPTATLNPLYFPPTPVPGGNR